MYLPKYLHNGALGPPGMRGTFIHQHSTHLSLGFYSTRQLSPRSTCVHEPESSAVNLRAKTGLQYLEDRLISKFKHHINVLENYKK